MSTSCVDVQADVQAVFDKVINAGYYGRPRHGNEHVMSSFMCISLDRARNNGLITWDECTLAKTAISGYLTECFSSLTNALAYNRHPFNITARLAIYRDWANRPVLTRLL